MNAHLSDLIKRTYPYAWGFFTHWSGRIIPLTEPVRHDFPGRPELAPEVHAVLASSALHVALQESCRALFFLENSETLLVLNEKMRHDPNLMEIIKTPTRRKLPDGSENPHLRRTKDAFPRAHQFLHALAEEAWVSPGRYYETSIASYPYQTRREVALLMAVRSYITSFELLLDKPVSFRFRAPWDIAAASSVLGQGHLAKFSSPEAQAKALAAHAA